MNAEDSVHSTIVLGSDRQKSLNKQLHNDKALVFQNRSAHRKYTCNNNHTRVDVKSYFRCSYFVHADSLYVQMRQGTNVFHVKKWGTFHSFHPSLPHQPCLPFPPFSLISNTESQCKNRVVKLLRHTSQYPQHPSVSHQLVLQLLVVSKHSTQSETGKFATWRFAARRFAARLFTNT